MSPKERLITKSMKVQPKSLFDHYSKKNKDVLLGKTDNNRIVEANAALVYLTNS